jgi:hypothetical protein
MIAGFVSWAVVGAPFVVFCGLATGLSMKRSNWFDVVAGGAVGAVVWGVLGLQLYKWWREGRHRLWLCPLMWIVLLIPYTWPFLLFRRPRQWWQQHASGSRA